jgi:putative toxin-antitoxin system antitoxin component (TIGR02293 family)
MKGAHKSKPIRKAPARPVSKKSPAVKAARPVPKKAIARRQPSIEGLAFGEFEALRKQLDLSLDELSARLGLSRSAIEERKAAGHLTRDESGKVVCYARLLGHAMYLFGGLSEARQWLKTPQRGLHGAVPLDYAKTDLGAREVENLLTQLGRDSP